jgi:membrane protein DedA with SNARE-associated domain
MLFEMDAQTLLQTYGYYAILIWTFLEGETVVVIAGMLAQQGMLSPPLIALCAFCGSCSSDQIMFLLGKYKGPAVLARFPRLARNTAKAERLIHKYETALILGFRFVYGVRNVTPVLLGMHRVSHLKFLVLNIIGAGVWACAFTAGGYFFGKLFSAIMDTAQHLLLYILAGAGLLAAIIWRFRRRGRATESGVEGGKGAENGTPPPSGAE